MYVIIDQYLLPIKCNIRFLCYFLCYYAYESDVNEPISVCQFEWREYEVNNECFLLNMETKLGFDNMDYFKYILKEMEYQLPSDKKKSSHKKH